MFLVKKGEFLRIIRLKFGDFLAKKDNNVRNKKKDNEVERDIDE